MTWFEDNYTEEVLGSDLVSLKIQELQGDAWCYVSSCLAGFEGSNLFWGHNGWNTKTIVRRRSWSTRAVVFWVSLLAAPVALRGWAWEAGEW